MIATESSLHWFLLTAGEPITFVELWRQCGVLRRSKAQWPPETPDQLRTELRALAAHGLATTWVDGDDEIWRGEWREVEPVGKVDRQGSLFG